MKDISSKTFAMLLSELAVVEVALRNEYNRQLTAQCASVLAELAADGMDSRIRFDYPCSSKYPSRKAYVAQKARYDLCNLYTKSVKCSLSMHEPNIRIAKEDNAKRIAEQASKAARAAIEGFCHKLTGKIDAQGSEVFAVNYVGGLDVWGWSHIVVNAKAASQQIWRTKMIVNVSCLGKLFNQWPTSLVTSIAR